MSFTSFAFIAFVAVAVGIYYLAPGKVRWAVLLAASIVFYMSFSPAGILLLFALSLAAWFFGLRIGKIQGEQKDWLAAHGDADKETWKAARKRFQTRQKKYVALTVGLCVGALFLLKYYGPFAASINRALGTRLWTAENLLIPLGISFYSLQLIGYVIDVSRGVAQAERNPLKVTLYAAFFLSIMQGPFNRWNDLMPQLVSEEKRKLSFEQFKSAILLIAWGYIKKMCIADQVALVAAEVFGHYTEYAGLTILLGAFCFAVQLYADFSGYMEIVSGVGALFGINMPQNFRQPFFSRNMSEFWQRWHITLGAWLKDYVFYPLLKSAWLQKWGKWLTKRFGKEAGRRIPTYLGMLILWTLIGAWHGAGFNYVFGVGLLQFLYIFLGEITAPLSEKVKRVLHIRESNPLWHVFQSLRCTALMILAWLFFNSPTFMDAIGMLGRIFAQKITSLGIIKEQIRAPFFPEGEKIAGLWPNWLVYIFLCTVVLLIADFVHAKGVSIRLRVAKRPYLVRMAFYLALTFTLLIFGAYGAQYNANDFIYFQF